MKRTVAIVVALAVILLALWYWRDRSQRSSGSRQAASGAAAAGAAGNQRAAAYEDPRTLARASIHGVVRTKGGAALAGAQVCTIWSGKGVVDEDSREPTCATTDASGAYALTELVPAWHSLVASAAAHQPRGWRDPATGDEDGVRLEPGERRTGIDFALASGGAKVSGVVEDVSGGPIAGALVTVATDGWWSSARAGGTRTDAQGRFTVWSKPGETTVAAIAEGYAGGQATAAAPSAQVEIYLTPEASLSGTVVSAADQRPIAGARVAVTSRFGEGSYGSARSDAQGHFRLTRLAPGRYKPFATGHGLYGEPAESVLLGLGQSVDGLVIPVSAASIVRGTVVIDAAGKTTPCPAGYVALHDKTSGHRENAVVEDDGVVEVTSVLPGHYELDVHCRDHAAQDRYPPIDVVAGQDVDGLVWKVTAGATIVGVVRSAAGELLGDASVSARSTGGAARGQTARASALTGDDGRFRLTGLIGGDYLLRASHDGERAPIPPPKATVAAGGETSIEIVFPASGAIAGTVVDTDGKPVAGAKVSSNSNSSIGSWNEGAMSGDDGSFTIAGVEPGLRRVTASRGWFDDLRRPGTTDDDRQGEQVRVVAGQTATTRLVVEARSGTISGLVQNAKHEPVVDAWIVATRESDAAGAAAGAAMRGGRWTWGSGDRPVVTGLDGRFTVTKLSPGTYTLRGYRKGGGEAVAEHVAIGATATLTIPSTGSFSGIAVLAGGAAPEQVEITLANEQTGFDRRETFFRTGGKFVLRDLPAGDFVVTADAAGGRAETTVTLGLGEDRAGVTLTLEPKLMLKGRFVDLDTSAPVAGLRASASPARGAGGGFSLSDGGDRTNISGEDGRFVVQNAPSGLLQIMGMPKDFMGSAYGWAQWIVDVRGGPEVDVGDIPVAKRRFKPGDKLGSFGLAFVEPAPDSDPRLRVLTVSHARADGPAAKAGIVAGDVIVSVDGYDVKGARSSLAWPLMRTKTGAVVRFGLERGPIIAVTADEEQ